MDWSKNKEGLLPVVRATTNIQHEESSKNIRSLLHLTSQDTKEFVCGWGAAVINVTVTYPLNKIIFRQILENVAANDAVRQLSSEGLRLLYRGILPPLCQKTLSLSIMFSAYEGSKTRLILLSNRPVISKVLAANIAGTAEAILMPLERVQTLLQDWRYHNQFRNTAHAFQFLLLNYGITECYRGLLPIILRNGLSNLTFFTLRDESKTILGEHNHSVFTNFISGALIGGFTSTLFYPLNVIKINMQSKVGGEFEKIIVVLREIWITRNRSITSFYHGVHMNFMRSFISWGVINAAYDCLKVFIM